MSIPARAATNSIIPASSLLPWMLAELIRINGQHIDKTVCRAFLRPRGTLEEHESTYWVRLACDLPPIEQAFCLSNLAIALDILDQYQRRERRPLVASDDVDREE